MNDKLKRLLHLHEMHSFQVIALVGLVMSVLAHVILTLLNRQIPSFSFIYPTWVIVFFIGYFLNLNSTDNHHH